MAENICSMKLSEFDFYLPKMLVAQTPISIRDNSKLMIVKDTDIEHRHFYDIVDYLNKDDTIVLNDTKVIPAKLVGKKHTGGKIEILILNKLNSHRYKVLVKGKKIKAGLEIIFENSIIGKIEKHVAEGEFIIEFNQEIELNKICKMPLPPYIKEDLTDQNRYNTVYSKYEGSLASPTAGLHFTEELLKKISQKCNIVYITLHITPETFASIKTENILEHHMDKEWFRITEESAEIINNTKGRLIAVGTTVVKTLESACENKKIKACESWSNLFIYPSYKFKSNINGMITNFHLPKSTVLLLTCAFADKDRIFNAYKEAIKNKYRFYSFGDSMLILK